MKQSPLSLLLGFLSFLNPFQKGFSCKDGVAYCSRRQGPTGLWEKYPKLHYHLFNRGKANLLKTDVELQSRKIDPSKKSMILITDDARAMVGEVSLSELLKGLKSEFNVVAVYLHESPRNILLWKDVLAVGPLDKGDLGAIVAEEIKSLQNLSKVECILSLTLECGEVLPSVWELGMPILHYIPEFLATPRHIKRLKKSLRDSTLQLFPTGAAKSKAVSLAEIDDDRRSRVLEDVAPQKLIASIKQFAAEAWGLLADEERECSEIRNADFFVSRYAYPQIEDSGDRPVRDYLAAWRSGWKPRKPCPGFHPGIYRDHHPDMEGDPTVDFTRKGRPDGPWLNEVLQSYAGKEDRVEGVFLQGDGSMRSNPAAIRVALHLHLHYTDGIGKLLQKIKNAKSMPDLFISVTSEEGKMKVKLMLSKYGLQAQEIAVFPNRGRDIGPFLTGFGPKLFRDYQVVGHLHSKKSPHAHDDYLQNWVEFLEKGLVGEGGWMMDAILAKMSVDPSIGIVYPDDPGCFGWEANYDYGQDLLRRMGFSVSEKDESLNFPVGTMFWARTAALKPLIDLKLKWEDYPEEAVPIDGSMLHAIERIFGIIPGMLGFRTVVTKVNGVMR